MRTETVYLGIGGNIGDRYRYLLDSQLLIAREIGRIVCLSSVYETPPWGFEAKQNFYNRVLKVETTLSIYAVLQRIAAIENKLNRVRDPKGYISRTADIDILLYGTKIIQSATLQVPHPRLQDRLFVLEPLAEIAPKVWHPAKEKTIQELLDQCEDSSICKKLAEY